MELYSAGIQDLSFYSLNNVPEQHKEISLLLRNLSLIQPFFFITFSSWVFYDNFTYFSTFKLPLSKCLRSHLIFFSHSVTHYILSFLSSLSRLHIVKSVYTSDLVSLCPQSWFLQNNTTLTNSLNPSLADLFILLQVPYACDLPKIIDFGRSLQALKALIQVFPTKPLFQHYLHKEFIYAWNKLKIGAKSSSIKGLTHDETDHCHI